MDAAKDACARRELKLYAGSCTPTHLHLLAGWSDDNHDARQIATRLKQGIGYQLAHKTGLRGWRWFSRGWDVTAVKDQPHFDQLVARYLPGHVEQRGVMRVWRGEGGV